MKHLLISLFAVSGMVFGLGFAVAQPVGAVNVFRSCDTEEAKKSPVCKEANTDSIQNPIQSIISLLLFAIGIVAVIMIIIGGIRYVISNGEPAKIKQAKDTILYSVVGLIVSMLAYVIVSFVTGQFG